MQYIGQIAELIIALVTLANFVQGLFQGRKLNTVAKEMNGMKAELVKSVGEAEFAKGAKSITDAQP